MSYHRASESAPKSGSPTMTVCTNHVAGGDLVEHGPPVAVAQAVGDVEVLAPEMVELEDERVGLATVSARPFTEELEEIGGPLRDEGLFGDRHSRRSARGAPSSAPVVGGSAGAAVVVQLPARLPTPGEVRVRQELPAAAAGLGRVGVHITNTCSHGDRTARWVELSVNSGAAPRGVAQSGSAPGWGPGGRRFKSCLPDYTNTLQRSGFYSSAGLEKYAHGDQTGIKLSANASRRPTRAR